MQTAAVQEIDSNQLNEQQLNALSILENLPVDKVNLLKAISGDGGMGVIGLQTVTDFAKIMAENNFNLSNAGVAQFKENHGLGNTGSLQGVIGPQTAGVYFQALLKLSPAEAAAVTINQAGLDLIKEFEGLSLTTYSDSVNVPTIGYGHTGSDVHMGMSITAEEASLLLAQDVSTAAFDVNNLITVNLTGNQYAALTSLVFNVGAGAVKPSTLLRLINAGQPDTAAPHFLAFDMAGGRVLNGLLRRRKAEEALFCTPDA